MEAGRTRSTPGAPGAGSQAGRTRSPASGFHNQKTVIYGIRAALPVAVCSGAPGRRTVPVPSLRGLGSGVSHAVGSKRLGRSSPTAAPGVGRERALDREVWEEPVGCSQERREGLGPGGCHQRRSEAPTPWGKDSRSRGKYGRGPRAGGRGLGQLRTCLILCPPTALWQRQGKAFKFTANSCKKAPQQPDAPRPHCRLPRQGEQSRQFLLSGSAKSHDKRWCDLAGFPEWHNLPEGVFPLCTG